MELEVESPVSIALDHTQTLLASTLGDDDEPADIASGTDPRALEKVRTFLKVLADNNAVCTRQFARGSMAVVVFVSLMLDKSIVALHV